METILTIVHIVVCFFLIIIVLLQHGKGADMGATFGGASNTVFGSEGPVPLLNKITTGAAVIFMLTSIMLAYFSAHIGSGSVMKRLGTQAPAPITAPIEVPAESGPTTIPMTEGSEHSSGAPAEFPVTEPATEQPVK